MSDPSSRMLQLLSLLQTHRYWTGTELVARLHVSIRTVRRDVDRLRELGYPVDAQRGVDGGYQLAAGAALPPLVLDDEEAIALALGLIAATSSPVEGTAESSVRALAKIVAVMPARLRRRIEAVRTMTQPARWGDGPSVDPEALTTVAQACRDAERITFTYTAADGQSSERLVEPLRLVPLGQRWYLVAYDLGRHDWRSFRLDRLSVAASTGARFRPRELPATDAAAFVRDRLRSLPANHPVTAIVESDAESVRRRIGRWATVEPLRPRSCEVKLNADSYEWAAMALGVIGAPFTVAGPAEFVSYLRDWAQRFSAATAAVSD